MARVWLSLGSNIDREENIRAAVRTLRRVFGRLILSSVYEGEAVGFQGPPFFNLVVGAETERGPQELIELFRRIEQDQGRCRGVDKFAPRTLDIDLLTYGDQVIQLEKVSLPRDEITRYAFVLLPLAEVAGEERHPLNGLSYRELWERFDQTSQPLWRVDLELLDRVGASGPSG